MLAIGHNDWFQISLSKGDISNIQSPFTISFNLSSKVPDMDFNSAADYTARIINQKYNNLHLCLSGGLDSEFVAKVLLRNQIPFTPVVVNTPHNSEIWYAQKFCYEHNLKPIVFDFSSKTQVQNNFYMGDLICLAYEKAISMNLPVVEALISNVISNLLRDDSINLITGFGDPLPISKTYDEPMGEVVEISDHDYYLELEYQSKHPGAFFSFTPELFKSMLQNIDTTLNSQTAKSKLYDLPVRPKSFSSFEFCKYVLASRNAVYQKINEKFRRSDQLAFLQLPRSEVYQMLSVDK